MGQKIFIETKEGVPFKRLPQRQDGSVDWGQLEFLGGAAEVLFPAEELAYSKWLCAIEAGPGVANIEEL
jgi:hypothetical protein